jgi:hypothetical protein
MKHIRRASRGAAPTQRFRAAHDSAYENIPRSSFAGRNAPGAFPGKIEHYHFNRNNQIYR